VDTLLNAGDRTPFVTLRFRDRFQNLVDNATTLYYASSDNAVTGIFPLTLISLGTYRADTLRFPIAGEYRLWVDTSSTGALLVIGKDYFTVETRGPVRVELTNVQTILQAGDTAQAYTFRFYDVLNNLTDLNIRPVVVTGTTYRDTLALTRTNTGVYESERVRYTTSGTFTITPLGIIAANITGDRAFTVLPRPAASVLFTGVIPTLNAGSLQSRFRATLRDTFNNLTDSVRTDSLTVLVPTQAYFSMSTDATVDDSTRQAAAGFFPLTRTSLGVFTADTVRFHEAGKYSVGMAGVGSTSGTAAFIVRPNVDFRVVFENVPDTLVAGDSLKNITVRYFDRSDNPTDNGIGRVVYARAGGSSTATVQMNRVETGVYALESTQATIAGTYNLGVSGITTVNMEGKRSFVVRGTIASSATFAVSTSAMKAVGASVTFSVTYKDRFNNLTDMITAVKVRNDEFAYIDTVTVIKKTTGVYTATKILPVPGLYLMELAPVNDPGTGMIQVVEERGRNEFGLNPYPAYRAVFTNVKPSIASGDVQTFTVALFDRNNAETDYLQNILPGSEFVSLTGAETRSLPARFLEPNNPAGFHVMTVSNEVFTAVGNYTLSVRGVAGIRHEGQRTFVVTLRPSIILQRSNIDFGGLPVNETTLQATPLQMVNLSGDVTITPPAGYEISVNGGAATPTFYDKAITVTPSASGAFTLTIRFKPTAVQDYNGTITLVAGTVQNTIQVRGRGVARTTTAGGVQIIDEKYFVENKLFYPVGWSQASGVPPTYVSKTDNSKIVSEGAIQDGIVFTRNPTGANTPLRVDGNIIEHESLSNVMDIGFTLLNPDPTKPEGRRVGCCGSYDNIDNMITYTKRYLDELRPTGMKVIFPPPRVKGDSKVKIQSNKFDALGNPKLLQIRQLFSQAETEKFVREIVQYEETKTTSPLFGWWHIGEPEERFRQVLNEGGYKNDKGDWIPGEGFFQTGENGKDYEFFDKPATFADAVNIINSKWSATDASKSFFYRPQSFLNTLYTSLKSIDPNHSFQLMIGPHSYNSITTYLKQLYSDPSKPYFDDVQAQTYLTTRNSYVPGNPEYQRYYPDQLKSYETLPEANQPEKVFLNSGRNFKMRWYPFDMTPEPTYYLSALELYVKITRDFHVLMRPTTTSGRGGVASIKSFALDLNFLTEPNPCLSCSGENAGRSPLLVEQMYYLFASMYWMQEPETPRVVNYGKVIFYSHLCAGDVVRVRHNNILKLFTDFSLGEALLQPKINPDPTVNPTTPVRVQTQAGAESTVKTIVRQYKGYYYVTVINHRNNNAPLIPGTLGANGFVTASEAIPTRAQLETQRFVTNPDVRIIVADNAVISAAEELTVGMATAQTRTLETITVPNLGVRQALPLMTLQPAEVRLFRFKIAHPTATAKTVTALAQQQPTESMISSTTSAPLRLTVTPNPTADVVTATFVLPEDEAVSLTLYNAFGAVSGTPVPTRIAPAGTHSVSFSVADLPTGVYRCVAQSASRRQSVMLHVIR
jgi:hypothetical protein